MSRVLGFDTSGPYCAAALFEDNDVTAARYEDMKRGQAERLMPMLEEVLAERGANWSDLDAIGVGIGPGNFTGVRISVSAARGLALGLGVPAVGVPLFDALAEGSEGNLYLTLRAPRDSYYLQTRYNGVTSNIELFGVAHLPTPMDGSTIIGQDSPELETRLNCKHAPAAFAPASAIARITARRHPNVTERPAPLYIRPADAAPPSDPPPKILT